MSLFKPNAEAVRAWSVWDAERDPSEPVSAETLLSGLPPGWEWDGNGLVRRKMPAWFTPSRHAVNQHLNVMRGLHPTGRQLGPEDATCGGCAFCVVHRKWRKCDPIEQLKRTGPAGDIRAKWRACELYAPTVQTGGDR